MTRRLALTGFRRRLLRHGAPLVAVGTGVFLAVSLLSDATQTRPDSVSRESRSEIVLEVATNGYLQPPAEGARNLWAACAGRTSRQLVTDPGIVEISEHRFRFSVEPGLGPSTRRKLVGCLEDTTIDRVRGTVISVELIEP